ncbi:MAG: SGNH/GDSL hydrolase family protein [Lachnospiraceae bacterium]|nr:SGNH/GDSL hydrolase family protein [Lachnospiraceae bacterium]
MGNKFIKIIYATVLLAVAAVCFIIFFKLVRSGIAKATSTSTTASEEIVESTVPSEDETISTEPDTPPASVSSADDSWFDEENVETSNGPKETVWTIPEDVDTTGHPILEDYEVLFIGDSLFTENDEDGLSIPCYFGYYTGADVYNISRGAMTAASGVNEWTCLPMAVDALRDDYNFGTFGDEILDESIHRYNKADHSGKKRIVIIDCCINDYTYGGSISGDIESTENYKGGLKAALESLRGFMPDAKVFFMTPYRYINYEGGTALNEKLLTQEDYVAAMRSLAEEYGIDLIDIENRVPLDDPNLYALKDD